MSLLDELEEVIERIEARGQLPISLQHAILEGQLELLREILRKLRKAKE